MNAEEFKQHVLTLKDPLYRFALSLLGSPGEAEDALQEVMLKLWDQRSRLQRVENLKAWCLRLTRNQCIDRLRSVQRERQRQNGIPVPSEVDHRTPDRLLQGREAVLWIHQALRQLPEHQQLAVQLRDIEGLSYQEIVDLLDMPMAQVKINLFRGRKKLRALLTQSEPYGQS